jgi:hypothetical protein
MHKKENTYTIANIQSGYLSTTSNQATSWRQKKPKLVFHPQFLSQEDQDLSHHILSFNFWLPDTQYAAPSAVLIEGKKSANGFKMLGLTPVIASRSSQRT